MEQLEAARWKEAAAALNAAVVQPLSGAQGTYEIKYWGATPGLKANPYHKHSFYEICLCTRGGGTYREKDERFRIEPGIAFCSRPEVYHQIVPDPDRELYLLYIAFQAEPDRLPPEAGAMFELLREEGPPLIRQAAGTPAANLWLALLQLSSSGLLWEKSAELLQQVAYSLLLTFPSLFAADRLQRGSADPVKPVSIMLDQARMYMKDNLAESHLTGQVARYLHISERHLSRVFRRELQMTIGEFIRRERIRSASELLRKSGLPIKDIAEKTGFGTVHYFTRIFRQATGWSPAAYRRSISEPDARLPAEERYGSSQMLI
ncbi:helix-turn-helix domain-containing protein [Paenibacillus ginsengarvi]|uniref:AraC family transcriptional regulator n=1 Tax=Paenibacillus ginsengarvi TaxID=400777 RepID=A0A3B0CFK8_9BACL|nr:AraC family transcriptional regulator [Paenibacillus ginsengarvi]RKN84383.1 AraC family transcriptional regulator [Paenibacillus ginsengarvi]